jgi:hypothetical protein
VAHDDGTEHAVMAEPRLLERLTASDLFMLLWDDYGWPNHIGGLAILDGTSLLDRDGRIRIEAVRSAHRAKVGRGAALPAVAIPTLAGAGLAPGRCSSDQSAAS